MTPDKCFRKVGMARLTRPHIFWALNANSSKMAKGTNFKFGSCVPRDSPHMFLTNVSEKWACSRSRDPVILGR